MPSYLSKPGFLIKGMGTSLRSPIRQQQLRKAEQLPGFKPMVERTPRGTPTPRKRSAATTAAKK